MGLIDSREPGLCGLLPLPDRRAAGNEVAARVRFRAGRRQPPASSVKEALALRTSRIDLEWDALTTPRTGSRLLSQLLAVMGSVASLRPLHVCKTVHASH